MQKPGNNSEPDLQDGLLGEMDISVGVDPSGQVLMLLSEPTNTIYMNAEAAQAVINGLKNAVHQIAPTNNTEKPLSPATQLQEILNRAPRPTRNMSSDEVLKFLNDYHDWLEGAGL